MFDFRQYIKIHPEVDFESSKIRILEKTQSAVLSCITHQRILSIVILCDEFWISKRAKRLSQARAHVVIARTSLFTDPKNVMFTNSSQVRAFSGRFENIHRTILRLVSNSSFLKLWSSKPDVETVYNCSVSLFASSQYLSTHYVACLSVSQDHATVFVWGFSHPGDSSVAVAQVRDSNISQNWLTMISFVLRSRWVHPSYVVKKWSLFVKFHKFHQFLPHWGQILLLSSHSWVIHAYRGEWALYSMNKETFPIRKSQQNFIELFSHKKPSKWMSVQTSFKRNHWIFNGWPWFGQFVSWETYPYIYIYGHYDAGILSNLGASAILLGCKQE